jgi:hypothetical protein
MSNNWILNAILNLKFLFYDYNSKNQSEVINHNNLSVDPVYSGQDCTALKFIFGIESTIDLDNWTYVNIR